MYEQSLEKYYGRIVLRSSSSFISRLYYERKLEPFEYSPCHNGNILSLANLQYICDRYCIMPGLTTIDYNSPNKISHPSSRAKNDHCRVRNKKAKDL
jgi:hypothetical protein